MNLDFFQSPMFWAVVTGIGLFAYGVIAPIFKRVPILNNKSAFMWIGIIGLLLTTGILGSMSIFGTGSVAQSSIGSKGFVISDIQLTTSFASSGGCTLAENSNQDDLLDIRCTDAQANETASIFEINNGILTVTRQGDLKPMSCPVVARTTKNYGSETTPGDGNTFTILEVTTLGLLEAYLGDGANATTTSPLERTSLTFAEGDATQTLGVLLEVDEDAHDNLNQYSYRDVVLDVCGKPYTLRAHRM